MFQPDNTPVLNSLALSAILAALPLITLFVLLGGFRLKAHWAGLASLAVALAVAIVGYRMPVDLAFLSASEGLAFGLFPIMWIVLTALWIHKLTVASGRFDDLRRSFNMISDDLRIQALIIAFCFGALLEALAGFGAPVAITGVMLMAIGFPPARAAITVLVANTAPVAFGAMAIPIITAGNLTKISYQDIGAVVGRQTPLLALFVPLFLVILVDGWRGLRQTWPAALLVGVVFAAAKFVISNYVSVELTDVVASLLGLASIVLLMRVWKPRGSADARADLTKIKDAGTPVPGSNPRPASGGTGGTGGTATQTRPAPDATVSTMVESDERLSGSRIFMSLLPYLVVVAIFSFVMIWDRIKDALASTDWKVGWPGLDGEVFTYAGKAVSSTVYNFTWLSSPGTLLLASGVVVAVLLRIKPLAAARQFFSTIFELRWPILTVASVLSLAYVMNLSGQTVTIGSWIAGTGAAFAFLSPILGWLGTAVTGSDTSAQALFATLQQAAANKAGLDEALLVAANSSGGVVGKMISPQNLAIAAAAVGMTGKESVLFRGAMKWSLAMLLAMCVLVYLQSNILAWMV